MRDIHRVQLVRITTSPVDLKTKEARTTVYTAMPCLVEELAERDKESVLGRISGARYRISWDRGRNVRNDDIVKYGSEWFRVREAALSTGIGSRRVQRSTAILDQDHGRHDLDDPEDP